MQWNIIYDQRNIEMMHQSLPLIFVESGRRKILVEEVRVGSIGPGVTATQPRAGGDRN